MKITCSRAALSAALLALALLAWFGTGQAKAQSATIVATCGSGVSNTAIPGVTGLYINEVGQLCVSASVSASVTGFAPGANGTPISVTNASTTGTLPAGTVVVATNVGSNAAYCTLGASTTTSGQYLAPSGGWFAFTVGAATQLSCITASSTTTVNMVGGSGLPTGTGGGGGGGGGAVFGPTAVGSANANPPVVIGGTVTGAAGQNVGGVAIKPASTLALSTDQSLVVQENPNSALITAVNSGVITNGSAPPSTSIYMGANASGATGGLGQGIKQCDQTATYDASTNGATLLKAGVSGRKFYICGWWFGTGGTATNIKLIEGTTVTTPCDTGASNVTPAFQLAANTQSGFNGPFWNGLGTATAADNLCINTSAGNAVQAIVWFTIQ